MGNVPTEDAVSPRALFFSQAKCSSTASGEGLTFGGFT